MMQFLFPVPGFPVLEYEKLASLPSGELEVLKGRFLLVGERSRPETFHTPFGDRLGVEVHAAAIEALVTGHWITRPPWWSGLLILVVACYLLVVLAADGASVLKLVAVALGISAFVVAGAALTVRLWYVWLDVVYPWRPSGCCSVSWSSCGGGSRRCPRRLRCGSASTRGVPKRAPDRSGDSSRRSTEEAPQAAKAGATSDRR